MHIVFLNSMEKRQDERLIPAKVWIGEERGVWRMGWSEFDAAGQERESIWYEGGSWSEMLHIFRHGLAMKLSDGFRPLIEGVFHEKEAGHRTNAAQKLICYSELHGNEELYNELAVWRRKKASGERKAPYFIASNRVLRLISTFVPQTVEELLQLPGVGDSKVQEYGQELLQFTSGMKREHTFPLDWVYRQLDDEAFMSWFYKQKENKYKQDLDQYKIRRSILEGISAGVSLEQLEEQHATSRRELVELLEQLEQEGYDTDALIESELAHMSEEEKAAVWKAYEELGDTLLKPVLQHVYGTDIPADQSLDQLYEKLRMIRIRYRRQASARLDVG
ncbi:HRDC domain-containing protein [Paenibacillus sediminis]|uniref:HRDC domain-containing protein n=1 Tax=Paenibacillus sediminis TaxID=664909 RepID=A0ABS4H7Y3_9BACL|nr:HRDC domain-containing protein [Paenibacillus sediminis]MBP1938641.1 hypothetical protein [Paenibacillus sediminis]